MVDPQAVMNSLPLNVLDTKYKSVMFITHRVLRLNPEVSNFCVIQDINPQSGSFSLYHSHAGITTLIMCEVIDRPHFETITINLVVSNIYIHYFSCH